MVKFTQIGEKNEIHEVLEIQERNSPWKCGEISYDKKLPAVTPVAVGEFGPIFQIDWRLCDGCGLCAEVCPADLVIIQDFKAMVPREKHTDCYECGSCMSVCMYDAIFRV